MANTAPLGGTRDFLPRDAQRRAYVVRVIEEVYQSYGFAPLMTPALERLDTLLGKYGEEGDQLIFRVLKRGEDLERALTTDTDGRAADLLSDAGLRYDLTVPLARVVAEYRGQLPRIFKRYQIQPVYRADRPARGRWREFYQCDIDVIGSASPLVEAEVISAAATVLTRLGFGGTGSFVIRLNHRGVLRGLMDVAGVDPALEATTLTAIDKLDKIGLKGVGRELAQRGLPSARTTALLDLLTAGQEATGSVSDVLAWLDAVLAPSVVGHASVANLRAITSYTAAGPAADHVRLDPFVARGLSYYTGAIFEIALPGLAGSGGAGGRYDDLLGMFADQSIPACGFSLGLERLLLLMDERRLFPERLAGQPEVLVTVFDAQTAPGSAALASRLRVAGLRVDLYPDAGGYGRQFKYAEARGIPYAALVSPREITAGVVAMKNLITGTQEDVPADEVATWVAHRLS